MAKRLALPGFEGHTIEVQLPGLGMNRPTLFVDGKVAPRDQNHQIHLRRNDGQEVVATWKPQALGLGVPQLVVQGTAIDVVQPQKWYAWVWSALPLLVIVAGGVIGIAVGLIGFAVNRRIFWSGLPTTPKFVFSGIVSFFAVLLWVVAAFLVALYTQP